MTVSFYLPSTLNLLDPPKSFPKLITQPGTHSYTLCLPRELRAIHPVFHVSHIKPNTILNQTQEPPPPVEVEGEEHYEVGDILDSKIEKRYR